MGTRCRQRIRGATLLFRGLPWLLMTVNRTSSRSVLAYFKSNGLQNSMENRTILSTCPMSACSFETFLDSREDSAEDSDGPHEYLRAGLVGPLDIDTISKRDLGMASPRLLLLHSVASFSLHRSTPRSHLAAPLLLSAHSLRAYHEIVELTKSQYLIQILDSIRPSAILSH